MSLLFKKIMAMVRKTGDRCIIFDPSSDEAFVLMDFGSYEAFLAGTTKRLTGYRAGDIMEPVNPDPTSHHNPLLALSPDEVFAEPSEEKILEDERFYLEPID